MCIGVFGMNDWWNTFRRSEIERRCKGDCDECVICVASVV